MTQSLTLAICAAPFTIHPSGHVQAPKLQITSYQSKSSCFPSSSRPAKCNSTSSLSSDLNTGFCRVLDTEPTRSSTLVNCGIFPTIFTIGCSPPFPIPHLSPFHSTSSNQPTISHHPLPSFSYHLSTSSNNSTTSSNLPNASSNKPTASSQPTTSKRKRVCFIKIGFASLKDEKRRKLVHKQPRSTNLKTKGITILPWPIGAMPLHVQCLYNHLSTLPPPSPFSYDQGKAVPFLTKNEEAILL